MTKIITIIALFVASLVSAQGQFEQGMGKALQTWNQGKPAEAVAQLERIASVEKTNWLPNYYIALINITQAFGEQDKTKMLALIEAAQKAQDVCNDLAMDHPEVLVMQSMIHTASIVYDPMTNGQKLSGDVLYILNKAYKMVQNDEIKVKDIELTIQDTYVRIEADRLNKMMLIQIFGLMSDTDTYTFKFPRSDNWLSLNKAEMGLIVNAFISQTQLAFDWENSVVTQIDSATDFETLATIDLGDEENRILPGV
jgi:hypothetical protein